MLDSFRRTGQNPQFEVFLSSTMEDMKDYRKAVKNRMQSHSVNCLLPDAREWPASYRDVPALCLERVGRTDAFVLIPGHWYGSIPNGADKSMTHLEFEAACAKYRHVDGRMFVLMPALGSPMDRALAARAERIVKKRKQSKTDHKRKLHAFRSQIRDWKYTHPVYSKNDLVEWTSVLCKQWIDPPPLEHAKNAVRQAATPDIDPAQLGRLGRQPHFEAVKNALSQLEWDSQPAIALLVHGRENAGHREFLLALRETKDFCQCHRESMPVKHQTGQYGIDTLTQLVAESLGFKKPGLTPERLAELTSKTLEKQNLYFMLSRASDLQGGLAAFQETFWAPFFGRLRDLRQPGAAGRLFAVISVPRPWDATWESVVSADAGRDYSKLIRIPELTPIQAADVVRWLEQERNMPSPERTSVARTVLKDADGNQDGTPADVFARLKEYL